MLGDELDDDMKLAFEHGRSQLNRPGSEYNTKIRSAISLKGDSFKVTGVVGRGTERGKNRDASANRGGGKKAKKIRNMQQDLVSDISDMEGQMSQDDDDNFELLGLEDFGPNNAKMFDFPKPLYPQKITVGDVSGKTKLQQICEQLYIKEEDYVWYNSNQSIKVRIPPELYQDSFHMFERLDAKSGSTVTKSSVRSRAAPVPTDQAHRDSVLGAKHPRVLLTKDTMYIFALKSKLEELEEEDHDRQGQNVDGEDVAQERLDRLNNDNLVHVMDVQTYPLMDFEFIQRLPCPLHPPRTFIVQAYNKTTKQVDQAPAIQIECKKDDCFFILTHLIEKFLPLSWQAFFERTLSIRTPDCYQFHCYLMKKNAYGQRQPRFFVISQVFMYNTDCAFNAKTGQIEFNTLQWQMPIQAITKVTIAEEKAKKIKMVIAIDGSVQNQILTQFGFKKVSKTERSVEFAYSKRTTARDFLWHLKRIHHWWNCCSEKGQNKPALQVDIAK